MVDTDARIAWRLFHLNWLPIAIMGSLLALAILSTDFALEPVAYGVTIAIALSFVATAYRHQMTRAELADPKLVFSIGTIGQAILVCAIVGPLSYIAGSAHWPLQDQTLLAMDRALGMDPEPIARFVNDHPWLADILARGYGLIKWPLLGIPIVLAFTERYVRLQLYVLAMSLALMVTITISAFAPAIGTYYGLHLAAAQLPDVNTSIYAAQLRDILALRDGSLREIELFKLAGIVSFPSFHAASAVLYMWALWPVRRLGGIAACLNLLMIAAAPVIGAHYMVDVIGGVVLAAASILAAKLYLERLSQSQSTAPVRLLPVFRPHLGVEPQ